MLKKAIWIGMALAVFGLFSAFTAAGDESNKTVLTFNQPVEIPGQVLPAGTYTFKLVDSINDRHVVQIFNADGSQIIATVLTIPDYRLQATDQTLIKFGEVPVGSPDVIRAWFYPGETVGQEFVYPKARATQLAKASNAPVPAITADVTDIDALKTASIVAVTPDEKEMPVAAAIQTTPLDNTRNVDKVAPVATVATTSPSVAGTTGATQTAHNPPPTATRLPKTASALPLILMLGLGSIGLALCLMVFAKYEQSSVV